MPEQRPCPFCAEPIRPDAATCRHCGHDLPSGWASDATVAGPEQQRPAALRQRRPWLAAILSICAPGVGQIYASQLVVGWWLFGLFCLIELGVGFIALHLSFTAAVAFVLIAGLIDLLLRVGSGCAAFVAARRARGARRARYQRGWVYVALIVMVPLLGMILVPGYNMKSYVMPSGSMLPTLLIGDH